MSCSDFKSSSTTNLRGMKRKLDMKLNGDRLRKQLTKGPSPPTSHRSKIPQNQLETGKPAPGAVDALHHHNYHHQLKTSGDQLLCRLRQTMFNISLAKLSRYRHIPDPSLLRSVMICNTLKRLEKDLEHEGIKVSFGPNGVYFVPNNSQNLPVNYQTTPLTTIPTSPSQCPPPSSPRQTNDSTDPCQVPSSFDDDEMSNGGEETFLIDLDSGGRVTPFPRKMDTSIDDDSNYTLSSSRIDIIDTNGDIWQAQGEKWSSTSIISCADDSEMQDETHTRSDSHLNVLSDESQTGSDLHELQPAAHLAMATELGEIDQSMRNATLCSPDPTNPVGSFGTIDIDVNQYDFDMISPISAPNMRLTPVSAEELLKSVIIPNENVPVKNMSTVTSSISSSPLIVSSTSSMTVSSSSCATQSTQSVISNSKQYYCKKDSLLIDDFPTAIS